MVEQVISLDNVFSSLSDPTRRDILHRVAKSELTISEIAKPYDLSFAAVSKHLMVLERAKLITKRRRGKEQMVSVVPQSLKEASDHLENYRLLWEERFDALDKLLSRIK
jgi:DNA-binding transcriptional ArsR family regulator